MIVCILLLLKSSFLFFLGILLLLSKQSRKLVIIRILLKICPGLNVIEIQIPYDKHHKVSSLVKSNQNTHNSVKYELIYEKLK